MNAAHDSPQHRTIKAKKPAASSANAAGASGPTTFFLRSEKDIEIAPTQQQRGRKASRAADAVTADNMAKTTTPESTYGVQSLEDTINASFHSPNPLSRTDSNTSDASADAGANELAHTAVPSRKRKSGNPVHPRIAATGQRIISAEQNSKPQSTAGAGPARSNSPLSVDSPIRSRSGLRRNSASSSAISNLNSSQPLTPWKMSPQPESAMPSTPRSGSPKSFRLSDEEASVAGSNNSQVVQSSSEEEDVDGESVGGGAATRMPQLVMPHIAMPSRRPFTERGKRIGRLKLMVVGSRGVGKTSLIESMCRTCEDIVHLDALMHHDAIDGMDGLIPMPSQLVCETSGAGTMQVKEIGASTRSYPAWWTDFENCRQLRKPKSVGEGVLERNITFIDTPGFHDGCHYQQILDYFKYTLGHMGRMEKIDDCKLVNMLSGEGGLQIDAVIYIFQAGKLLDKTTVDEKEAGLLSYLCKWTNVIPIIGRADESEADGLVEHKIALRRMFKDMELEPFLSVGSDGTTSDDENPNEPFAISSALADDSETIDASVLMASSYLQPLVSSDLSTLVDYLFDPSTTARLRHTSAVKFLLWRQQNMGAHLDLHKHLLPISHSRTPSPSGITTTTNSDHPLPSPTASDTSLPANPNPETDLSRALNTASPSEPFRQIRLAKWAQDLQRSLHNEGRRRYQQLYNPLAEAPDENAYALSSPTTTTHHQNKDTSSLPIHHHPPSKTAGHLGGPLSIIDPRDPLGLLAFSQALRRRGAVALRVAGGFGIVGVVAWWVLRHWEEVVAFLGVGEQQQQVVEVVRVKPLGPAAPAGGSGMGFGGWREWVGL